MRRKGLVIGLLMMLAVVVSGFTYAIWANIDLSNNQLDNTVTIGTGRTATVGVTSATTGGVLVPSGQVINSVQANAVDSYVFTFQVTWNDDAEAALTGTLNVDVTNILVDGGADTYSLVSVVPSITSQAGVVRGSTTEVTVTVTLGLPGDATEYAAVAGKAITFDVNFLIDNVQLP